MLFRNLLLALFSLTVCLPASANGAEIDDLIRRAISVSQQQDYRASYQLLFRAQQLAIEQKNDEKLFWVLTNLGINQAEQCNYVDALNNFTQAQQIAESNLSLRQVLSIRNNIAGLYALKGQDDKAIAAYLAIYKLIDKKTQNNDFRSGCALNIANLYIRIGDTQRALPYMRVAEKGLSKQRANAAVLCSMKAEFLLAEGQPDSAYAVLDKTLRGNADNQDLRYLQARILLRLGYTKVARNIADSLLLQTGDFRFRKDLFQLMAEVETAEANYPLALAYKDSVVQAAKSIFNNENERQYESMQIQFDSWKKQEEKHALNARNRWYVTFLVLSILAMLAALWAWLMQLRAHKRWKQFAALKSQYQLEQNERLERELNQQQAEAREKQIEAQRAIEQRSQELISKALLTASKNDQLRVLLDKLAGGREKSLAPEEVKMYIQQMQKQLDSTEEWRDFTIYFERTNASFLTRLRERYPSLSANDTRFLSLVSIGLTTKEISLLLNITPEYCKKKKQNLAHKLGLSTTQELYTLLTDLMHEPEQGK